MASRFVRPDTVRIQLVDVARRVHAELVTAHADLLKREKPAKATPEEIATSARRVSAADRRVKYATDEGAWIEVKRRLNAGEQRAAYGRMYLASVDGTLKVNPIQTGVALITAYLVDWSLKDDEGKPVIILDVSVDTLTFTLDALDLDSFAEIKEAIEAHEQAMLAEREAAKNVMDGGKESSAISPSPSVVAGGTSGLPN